MCRLGRWIGFGDLRAWLAQAEAQLSEQSLALTNPQFDGVLALQERREGWPIPEVRRQAEIQWTLAERRLDRLKLLGAESSRPTDSLPVEQAGESARLEALHPVYDGAWTIAEMGRDLGSGHALGNKQHSVQAMVVTRRFVAANLVLQRQYHRFPV